MARNSVFLSPQDFNPFQSNITSLIVAVFKGTQSAGAHGH